MASTPIPLPILAGGVNRDYATIVEDLKRLIPALVPEWTYQGSDDFGMAMLQLLAYLADHAHYHADATLRDTSIATTIYRWLAVEQAEWLGYQAARAAPARATVTLTRSGGAHTRDISIPKGTRLSASSGGTTVYFEVEDDDVLPAGSASKDVVVVEGRTYTVSLGTSTGALWETFTLSDTAAIFAQDADDLTVYVGAAEAELVRWPLDATSDTLAYWVRELRTGELQLRFGDGNYGSLLPAGQTVTVTYRSGGGRVGNVAAGTITALVSTLYDDLGVAQTFTATNSLHAIGGAESETLDQIRTHAPAFFRSQDRLVTLDDYKTFVEAIPGIYQAQVVHYGVNGVLVYVVVDNVNIGTVLTDEQRSYWTSLVDAKRMSCDVVAFRSALVVPIDMDMVVHPMPGFRADLIRTRVRTLFTDTVLAVANNSLGQHLRLSDMIRSVEEVEGLDYVDVTRYMRRPTLVWAQAAGNPTFVSWTVSNDAVEQTWYIEMLTATTYLVRGSVSGIQVAQGQFGVLYTVDNGSVSWQIDAGGLAMMEGDRGTIRVGRLLWNIQLAAGEFPVAGTLNIS